MLYKRNFIFGFGFGIIFTSLIIYGAVSFFNRNNPVISGEGIQEVSEEISEEVIVAKAKSLGMDFVEFELIPDGAAEIDVIPGDAAEIELVPGGIAEIEDIIEELVEAEEGEEILVVFIPQGSSSLDIAEILEANNIINDKNAFNDFIVERGCATHLQWGEFPFTKNMAFDEILSCFM